MPLISVSIDHLVEIDYRKLDGWKFFCFASKMQLIASKYRSRESKLFTTASDPKMEASNQIIVKRHKLLKKEASMGSNP